MTTNLVSTFALLAWPVIAIALYCVRPIGQATLWTILGGYLLLPVHAAIKFEMIPAFDKSSIPNLVALIGCTLVMRRPPQFVTRLGIIEMLILVYAASPFVTAMLNTDAVIVGNAILPGEDLWDALSACGFQVIFMLPFFLARQLLRSIDDNEEIMRTLVMAGLVYSVLMLFEVRMSPQLHTWVYGYFPHSFAQQFRGGGFRPVVFIGHGLLVAFFAMTATVAAAALWRIGSRVWQLPSGAVVGYLSAVLLLCKTLGALAYAVVLVPLVGMAGPKLQVRVAALLVGIVFLYPALRAGDVIPVRSIIGLAEMVNDERAESLGVRFEQEHQLLDRALQRFLFGWGRWGRNRVVDSESGRDMSVTDGRWTIALGQFGLIGFITELALLGFPVFYAASALKYAESERESVLLAALALIVAINMFDQLPNTSITPWSWLLAGALLGRAEALRPAVREDAPVKLFAAR